MRYHCILADFFHEASDIKTIILEKNHVSREQVGEFLAECESNEYWNNPQFPFVAIYISPAGMVEGDFSK